MTEAPKKPEKLCSQCKFFDAHSFSAADFDSSKIYGPALVCLHPNNIQDYEPVEGRPILKVALCARQRVPNPEYETCRSYAQWFEPRYSNNTKQDQSGTGTEPVNRTSTDRLKKLLDDL